MIQLDLEHCTGCGACQQICPKGCIIMEPQENGFVFPKVDKAACVNCHLCNNVCPIRKSGNTGLPESYAVVNTNKASLHKASSGGAFDSLARYVLNQNGVVYGCAFNNALKAEHIRVDSPAELPKLYGSKYVQSDTNRSFLSVQDDLKSGRLVAFSGTPCQVAGLKFFLGTSYDKLILIDIICHGVPSQAYFDKYIKYIQEKSNGTIVDFQFRSKSNHGWSLSGEYTIENGEITTFPLYYFDDYYYSYFLDGSIYRPCCYSCKYANLKREGDFSLGDFWGVERLDLSFDTSNGCSLLLANTEKAKKIMGKLDVHCEKVDINIASEYNSQLCYPSQFSPLWEKRMYDFSHRSGLEIQKDFVQRNKLARLKGRIKYFVPQKMVTYIKRVRYKIKAGK